MMTGNGVMHNGTTILDEYGHNLDRLKASVRDGSHNLLKMSWGGGWGGGVRGCQLQQNALPS